MADERYYEETLESISLENLLRDSSDVDLEIVRTSNITGSSYGLDRDNQFVFVFKTSHEVMSSQIILYPQDVIRLSKISDYKNHFYENENRGLFIPKDIPSLEQCAFCGRYLRDYEGSDEPYCDDELGHIWCFEYDRVLVFHETCIKKLISHIEGRVREEPEVFISGTV